MMAAFETPNAMTLTALLDGWVPAPPIAISDMCEDSAALSPGALFVARAGLRRHGIAFAAQAAAKGAVAVLAEPSPEWPPARLQQAAEACGLPLLVLDNLSAQLSAIADRFFGAPSAAMSVVGVTGTNGKSSVVHYLAQAWGAHGAQMGTLGIGRPGELQSATHTTAGAIDVQRQLRALCDAGFDQVAMEVSSHGLDQGRVSAVRFTSTVLTNLSRDHFDYHGTREAYAAAKQRLFTLPAAGQPVVNAADPLGQVLIKQLADQHPPVLRYACNRPLADAELQGQVVSESLDGMQLRISGAFGDAELATPLIGAFNGENLLAVLGVLLASGLSLASALRRLAEVTPPPGRLQRIQSPAGPAVFVDYAHTPDALQQVLNTLRPLSVGKLICVFGCGGERDKGKRAPMGRIASTLADQVIITDDNPRGEDGDRIVDDILAGVVDNAHECVERNRSRAIREAIRSASRSDIVLIAGKGHETDQWLGDLRLAHDDAQVAADALLGWGR